MNRANADVTISGNRGNSFVIISRKRTNYDAIISGERHSDVTISGKIINGKITFLTNFIMSKNTANSDETWQRNGFNNI